MTDRQSFYPSLRPSSAAPTFDPTFSPTVASGPLFVAVEMRAPRFLKSIPPCVHRRLADHRADHLRADFQPDGPSVGTTDGQPDGMRRLCSGDSAGLLTAGTVQGYPTLAPTALPTAQPSAAPTGSASPTAAPTALPTTAPSGHPTLVPTQLPTQVQ